MNKIPLFLLILGGLNMGSIGLFEVDLIAIVCGGIDNIIARIIYSIFAACAIWSISFLFSEEDNINSRKIRRRKRRW